MGARVSRRIILRGLGGAAVAAPFLSSLWDRRSKGHAAAPPRPKQLIVMFSHYGFVTTKFFPVKSHGPLEAGDLVNTLAPLAPYANKLLIPRGIRAMNEWTADNKNGGGLGQANDPHLNVTASLFTLQPVTPNSTDPFNFAAETKFNAKPVGSSLDHVMAQQLSPSGAPLFMRVGNRNESPQSAISYLKEPGAPAASAADLYLGAGTPMQVFSNLTNLLNPAQPMSPDSYALLRDKKVTDLVRDDLATLERMEMSGEDRNRLAMWKALVNDVGTGLPAMCNQSLATRLGGTSENVARPVSNITNMVTPELDGADLYSVMAVLAAACNYNPVIFLKYPPNYTFSGLGINLDSDLISHRLDNAGMSGTCVPNVLDMARTIETYYAKKFAKLLGMLDGIQNGDGSTLLDNSAAVWTTDASDGCARNLNNFPIIQAGSCGGYFKTGWTVNVEDGAADLTQGNSELQCGPGGTGMVNAITKETGTDPKIANAPINKYFYNLMNAMGVKADGSGFPKVGGTEEVSKFGYSDRTTDFCGGFGAVAGAGIHDPGEYTALKAP
jgi:hypothetical protein